MVDISFNYCYSFRVDYSGNYDPELDGYIPSGVNVYEQTLTNFLDTKDVKYYIGKIEVSENNKLHYQMCLMFDDKPNRQSFMNIKKKNWVAKTKQPVSFTIARSSERLMSYVTKEDGYLITNMYEEEIKQIKPWEKKQHCKGCNCKAYKRTEYIIDYLKKLLKDKITKEIIAQEEYKKHSIDDYYENNEYESLPVSDENYIPSTYECKVLLATAHKHYFEKYDKHICRSTLIKIMLKTGMITHQDYISKTLGNLLSDEYV